MQTHQLKALTLKHFDYCPPGHGQLLRGEWFTPKTSDSLADLLSALSSASSEYALSLAADDPLDAHAPTATLADTTTSTTTSSSSSHSYSSSSPSSSTASTAPTTPDPDLLPRTQSRLERALQEITCLEREILALEREMDALEERNEELLQALENLEKAAEDGDGDSAED